MVDSEKKGRVIWKNHLNKVDGFEAEDMMGEIESVRVSEVMMATEKSKEMVALEVAVLGMSMNVNMGINRAKESSRE